MTGKRGVPGMASGIDRAVILVNQMKLAVEVSNDGAVRSIRGIEEGQSHILPRHPVGQVLINV